MRGAPAETLVDPVSGRGIVARTRSIAIAALAVSALFFMPNAAYAHDGLRMGTGVSSTESSGMGWAHYQGNLVDLSPSTDDMLDGARASVVMIGIEGGSFFRLQITGIDENAAGKEYTFRLHEGPCVAGHGALALGHYNAQKEAGSPSPWPANDQTEVHLDFRVDSGGNARVTANVPFIPLPEKRSIVIQAAAAAPAGSSAARLACLPLDIKWLANPGQ
jgi:superoxide dismutase, Cu-Zn family